MPRHCDSSFWAEFTFQMNNWIKVLAFFNSITACSIRYVFWPNLNIYSRSEQISNTTPKQVNDILTHIVPFKVHVGEIQGDSVL